MAIRETTAVAIVGAGVAGLTVANLLQRSGIGCVVLERRDRAYVEQRQRAGTIEPRAVRMFQDWGLAQQALSGPEYDGGIEIRVDGRPHRLTPLPDDPTVPLGRLCTQQALVTNLIAAFLAGGGDLRFGVSNVTLRNLTSDRPVVGYDGNHEITCQLVAGCDGDHGVSRTAIPDGILTRHAIDHDISWLTLLADVPALGVVMAVSDEGFAAQFPRGPKASRAYLEIQPGDREADWPDDRVWSQLRLRLGVPGLPDGPIVEKETFPVRAVVYEPMRYGNLFLVGDAAHIVSPITAKGMNLALYDAEVFARATRDLLSTGDETGLREYSATCLRRAWIYQHFSDRNTLMLHDAGNPARGGTFRRNMARAELTRLLTSRAELRAYAELMAGLG